MISELRTDDPAAVGPYRLLGRLGTGGMGRVFLGQSIGGRLVAVKVIRPELADEPGFRARFAREVSAARKVSGLFTALVVDADAEAELPWLATAYVAGPSLAEAVEEHGPLPVASVRALAAGLAEGLAAIHAAGVVHRDLKPANVLLADDGPRVIDFGISRAVETTMLTLSRDSVIGSPGFLSPEQAEAGEVGPPSDVFSLGAVLAFAATGEGPFGSGPTPALVYRVVNREPDLAPVPDQIRPLVQRCLAKDPAARPTPAAMLAELGGTELAVNWLPEPIAAVLGRYTPAVAEAAEVAPEAGADGAAPDTDAIRTPTAPGGTPAAGEPASTRPSRTLLGGRGRRLAWLAAAAAVLVVASTVTAVALTGGGPGRPSAEPPANPVAASTRLTGTPTASPTTKSPATKSPAPKPTARQSHPAHTTRSTAASGGGAGGGQQTTSPAPVPAPHVTTPTVAPPSTGTVPNVLGEQLAAASSALEARGFHNIPWVYECLNSTLIDDVIQQSPGAGASIALTSPVQLYLQANNCATVPDVIGFQLANAETALQNQGFTNYSWYYGCYGSSLIGAVVSQSPSGGTSYGKSQLVSIKLQANNC
ncbi:MAG TPA: protein kinase [Streptosporangiaceae bacterium]|jgi:eukaryotic-like serine/threonine-protein kinase|nr:protein kinase [Streptosporangiaceae bacterium]